MALTLDQSQTTSHSDYVTNILRSTTTDAQVFTAGLSGPLKEVHLWTLKWGTPTDGITVTIKAVNGGTGKPTGIDLASEVIDKTNVPNDAELTVVFTSPATIVSGTQYAILVKFTGFGGDPSNAWYLKGDNSHNYYAGGKEWVSYDSESTWSENANSDFWFKTYISSPTQQTILSDSIIKAVIQSNIFSDTKIKVTGNQQTILSDAIITNSILQTITSDAKILAPNNQQTILSDTKIKITGIQNTIFSDTKIAATIQQTILSDAKIAETILYNIVSKINFNKGILENITNSINSALRVLSDFANRVNYCKNILADALNDVRTHKLNMQDCLNDVRFLLTIQQSPSLSLSVGPQSLGKSYLHLYINSIEQTDAIIDTGRINKGLNSSHTFSFDLGRAYDATAPAMDSVVTIFYNTYLLYTGYITDISTSEQPENITVLCRDKYFVGDEQNKYFFVGHEPYNSLDLYYETLQTALATAYGINFGIGNFIPDTMKLWGTPVSEGIGQLVENCGNYSWFYDENEIPRLWAGGSGRTVTIHRQEIGVNIGLFDLLNHSFTTNVEDVVNQYIVIMGGLAASNEQPYQGYNLGRYFQFAVPAWDSYYEVLARNSSAGEGWDEHDPDRADLYKDVYRVWNLPFLNSSLESWTDEQPPSVVIYNPGGFQYSGGVSMGLIPYKEITEGFTIDYKNKLIIFQEPLYFERRDDNDETYQTTAPPIQLMIWKKEYYTYTLTKTENPEEESNNPLRFITNKVGDYADTIFEVLELPQLSYQAGIHGTNFFFAGWDDRNYAYDYAYWLLSKTAEPKTRGEIQLTLDAVCLNNIDLSCRIFINGITTAPMNIVEMNYDLNSFKVTLIVENILPYRRTVSISKHAALGG